MVSMGVNLNSLHKVLKDETRRKILAILSERGSASYSELMAELQIASTGRLNYHLKVLNGLISKDAEGRYVLSEKGKAAHRLLTEFPQIGEKLEEKRKLFYFILALTNALIMSNITGIRFLTNYRTWNFTSTLLLFLVACAALVVANTALYLHFRNSSLFTGLYNVSEEDKKRSAKAFLAHPERLGFVLMLGLSVPFAPAALALASHTIDWLFAPLLVPILSLIYGIARWKFHAFRPFPTADQQNAEAHAFWLGSAAIVLIVLVEFVLYARFNVALLVLLAASFLPYAVVYAIGRTKRFPDNQKFS
jgi:ArsR family transcriptional regulator, arsenate/arsenite/antimonite-responsive transcriptional repressor